MVTRPPMELTTTGFLPGSPPSGPPYWSRTVPAAEEEKFSCPLNSPDIPAAEERPPAAGEGAEYLDEGREANRCDATVECTLEDPGKPRPEENCLEVGAEYLALVETECSLESKLLKAPEDCRKEENPGAEPKPLDAGSE